MLKVYQSPRFLLIILCMVIAIVGIDMATKSWVSQAFYYGETLPIFPGFNLILAHNTGAAFSFLANGELWQRYFLTTVSAVVTLGFAVWLLRAETSDRLLILSITLIIAGAIGNLIDRVMLGYVVDFADFYFASHHWPAFNVADSAICIGTACLLWGMLKGTIRA